MANDAFDIAIAALDMTLAEAARPLTAVSTETLERVAASYAEVVNSDEGKVLSACAREKGLAMVALLMSAAEFKRAASRYAKALVVHMLTPEAPK